MDPYRLAVLGCGTVGAQVVNLLTEHRNACEEDAGRPLQIAAIGVRDGSRSRPLPTSVQQVITEDIETLSQREDIDLVVELIGGVELPERILRQALESGKDVVTANKAVLAERGEELFAVAEHAERAILFEAAVAGAIPIVQSLQRGLPASRIEALTGILNGTCNHVVGSMEQGSSFDDAVRAAQDAGFAEADPQLDLDGTDAAHKLALLARLLMNRAVPFDVIPCEGIQGIAPEDLAYGARHGWNLKLVARFLRHSDAAALGVYPAWVSQQSVLAGVRNEYNAILFEGEPFGSMMFQGKGAGGGPTAGSVVADILRAARGEGTVPKARGALEVRSFDSVPGQYYVRFDAPDRPGVLGRIAGALGENGVSIATVEQPEAARNDQARVHLLTHPVRVADLDSALRELLQQGVVCGEPLRVRREDIGGAARETST